MLTLKEIAVHMDCHPKTAKRWWKKLGVPPDQTGHGPNKWKVTSATLLIKRFNDFYKARGTTPQIVREKFAGEPIDKQQLHLPLKFDAIKKEIHRQIAKKITAAQAIVRKSASRKRRG